MKIGTIFTFVIIPVIQAQNSTVVSVVPSSAQDSESSPAYRMSHATPSETSDWTIYNWDPLMFVREQPMPFCLHRLRKDFANFAAQPPTGVYISPEEEDMTRVHALIVGPPGTPYEGGFFQFFMKFPPDYPIRPPRVRMVTTDAGRVSFNPNLYANGKVCLGILGTWEGPEWSPAQDLESVLVSIQSLMNEKPCNNEPMLWPARSSFVEHYNDVVQHETIRVAVCGQVEAALRDSDECPSAFREPILRTFVDGYDKYEDIAKTRLDYTGLMPKYLFKESRKYQYKQLLSRLRGLIDEVRQRVNATSTSPTAEATYQPRSEACSTTFSTTRNSSLST